MAITAGEVMDRAAVLLNDKDKTLWTYTVLLPYLQQAWDELLVKLENNHVKVTRELSSIITVAAGATSATLPSNLVQIIDVKERTQGSSENFTDMEETEWPLLNYTPAAQFTYYCVAGETLQFPAATTNREVRLRYVKSLSNITSDASLVNLINSKPYLALKTAAIAADLSGRAPEVAKSLEARAAIALHELIAVKVGGLQSIPVRRPGWR